MKHSSKRRIAVASAIIVLTLFLLRPGASRLKSRIITSISASVGRPVDIGSVHIRLLPAPGFDLANLVVYDDPAFGAEPILRASEVTANLRLMSLVRGRLEVSRLELTEPSLNLVHSESGRWNLEALLERTAHIPLAPTGKARSEHRPGFPYIEATSGRINFKNGAEKKPYALTNADFSLWQDSENTWGVRLKAQPFRSDLNLNDTGLLQVSGTWQRATAFRDTPLQFTIEWSRAQLGQFTKFFTGNDKGWRGALQLDAALSGTPAQMRIASTASLEDFRRYDITAGKALRLAGRCDAEYSSPAHQFHQVMCTAPVAAGRIALRGDLGLPGSHLYNLIVTVDDVPASAAVTLAQRAKRNLPPDLTAEGAIRGSFSMQHDPAVQSAPRFEGRGEIADFHLASAAIKAEIGPETLPILITDSSPTSSGRRSSDRSAQVMRTPEGPHLEIGPLVVGTGRVGSAIARGWVNRSGYSLRLVGDTEITRTVRLARIIGIPALATTAEGAALVDLQIAGSWTGQGQGTAAGFAPPVVTGSAKLRNVHAVVRGLSVPLDIVSAEIQLSSDAVRVAKINGKAAGSSWTGSMEMPRGCGTACAIRFDLNSNQVALSDFREWTNASPKKRPWYRALESNTPTKPSFLASLRASGHIGVQHLQMNGLEATQLSANLSLEPGRLEISELNADLLNGKHRGQWQVDLSVIPAICSGSGILTQLSLNRLATAMNDNWITGAAKASYDVNGPCPTDFWQGAVGTVQVEMTDGVLAHLSLGADSEPFRFTRLVGQARMHGGEIEIGDAKLDSPAGKYHVSGSVSLQRELDLKLERTSTNATAAGYAITGTVTEPRVTPLPGAEQARLKR